MKNKESDIFIPIRKIIKIINSCENLQQLKTCKGIIELYVNYTRNKGIINIEDIRKRLYKELNQKSFQLKMIKLFVKNNNKEYIKIKQEII